MTNRPINFNDPTGHMLDDGCRDYGCGGGDTSTGGGGGENYCTTHPWACSGEPPDDDDINELLGQDSDLPDSLDEFNQDCSWSGVFGGEGCDLHYMSLGLGLDAPTLIMIVGAGVSLFAPEVGVPIILAGYLFEKCAFALSPLCAAVKLTSVNGVFTVDKYKNIYFGPQLSWGKSVLPFGAISFNAGIYPTTDGHIPTESELENSIKGFSVSAGTIGTGGISYSPAADNKVSYYLVGAPEIFSVNVFQYNVVLYDANK